MKNETTNTDLTSEDFGLTPLLKEFEAHFPKSAKICIFLLCLLGIILLVTGVNLICDLAFTRELGHYPTLPFAILTSAPLSLLSIKFIWRERYAARWATSVAVFFMSIIFTQVNSELAANPTDNYTIICMYKIFLTCLTLLTLICISCYMFPKMPEPSTNNQHDNTNSSSPIDLAEQK
jgi:hypothetical protein